jgi:hypothetical protein
MFDNIRISHDGRTAEQWIQKAVKDEGALRAHFGIGKGETIPTEKIKAEIAKLHKKDEHSAEETKLLKQLQLALTLRSKKVPPPKGKKKGSMFDDIKIAFVREATDWSAPEFQEAVATLQPHVKKLQAWLSRNTTIRKWNPQGVGPSMTMSGNGAAATFSGQGWSVSFLVVGDRVSVEATPPRSQYPGWNTRTVAMAKVRDLSNPDSFMQYAGGPLDLIFKNRY